MSPDLAVAYPDPAIRRRPLRTSLLALTVGGALLLSACGDQSGQKLGSDVVKDGIGCAVESERNPQAPTVGVTEVGEVVDSKDEVVGTGCEVGVDAGTYLTLDLVGATAADGKVFTSSWTDKRPVTARLGVNQLLSGLETGLQGMKVGGRRTITIPAEQAYGAEGNEAQGIGPDQALVFSVDLVAATSAPLYCNPAQPIPAGAVEGKPTEVASPVEAPKGTVNVEVLTPGDGAKLTATDYVTVNYLGVGCTSGTEFDSSWNTDEATGGPREPLTIAMTDAAPAEGAINVIPGWTQGLLDQQVGSLVQLEIPATLAYGAQGQGDIGPNEPLIFLVQILSATDVAPTTTAPEATETTAPADGGTTVPGAEETTTSEAAEG